ncbi:MAG: hypothetical protein K5989_11770 [Lachnospiraceae bacterium]|nr:hypothetical protein [Lachnospiraceae bacterium]
MVKWNYVNFNEPKKLVIDSNRQIADRIEALAEEMASDNVSADDFSEGLAAEKVELLMGEDGEYTEESSPLFVQKEPEPAPPDIDVQEQIDAMLSEARAEAEGIIAGAKAEAENIRAIAEEDGRTKGYEEGYQSGMAETQALKEEYENLQAALESDFQKRISALEPMFIDTLTDIYEHIFHVRFAENKDIIFHLIQNAVRKVEGNSAFIIHVSKEDYGFVSMQKKELLSGISGAENAEIVEDMTLKPNECFIETGGGIFDCSLETQLSGLKKELKLLSYTQSEEA